MQFLKFWLIFLKKIQEKIQKLFENLKNTIKF